MKYRVGDYVDNVYFVRKPYDLDDLIGAGMNFIGSESDYRGERVRVDLVKELSNEEYSKFTSDFFADNFGLLLRTGGHDHIENYVHVVLVRNAETGSELFINTEGYKYARYVGVKNDIVEDGENVILIKRDSK